jgi:hypothetical protein
VVISQVLHAALANRIATRFRLSRHTVSDRLKAIYGETGVASRDELIASLSNWHRSCRPSLAAGRAPWQGVEVGPESAGETRSARDQRI